MKTASENSREGLICLSGCSNASARSIRRMRRATSRNQGAIPVSTRKNLTVGLIYMSTISRRCFVAKHSTLRIFTSKISSLGKIRTNMVTCLGTTVQRVPGLCSMISTPGPRSWNYCGRWLGTGWFLRGSTCEACDEGYRCQNGESEGDLGAKPGCRGCAVCGQCEGVFTLRTFSEMLAQTSVTTPARSRDIYQLVYRLFSGTRDFSQVMKTFIYRVTSSVTWRFCCRLHRSDAAVMEI